MTGKSEISLDRLLKEGTSTKGSFMGQVEKAVKKDKVYTEEQVADSLGIISDEDAKKVSRALNNLVRHNRISRLYHDDKPYFFKGDSDTTRQ